MNMAFCMIAMQPSFRASRIREPEWLSDCRIKFAFWTIFHGNPVLPWNLQAHNPQRL